MKYLKKYKAYICEQFKISDKDLVINNDADLIREIENRYKEIIKSKEDLIVEKIREKHRLARCKFMSLENIFTNGIILIITILLGFINSYTGLHINVYLVLIIYVSVVTIISGYLKAKGFVRNRDYYGYHNLCLLILDKIEAEFECSNSDEEKINIAIKEITDIKDFIGIR